MNSSDGTRRKCCGKRAKAALSVTADHPERADSTEPMDTTL